MTGSGDPGRVERYAWLYEQLLRIEEHRTSELQNQQTRIATVLVANGVLLGLLATAGVFAEHPATVPQHTLLVVAFLVLAAAALLGLGALWPLTRIRDWSGKPTSFADDPGLFLEPRFFRDRDPDRDRDTKAGPTAAERGELELLQLLTKKLAANIEGNKPARTLKIRRNFLYLQLVAIGGAVALLAIAAGRVL